MADATSTTAAEAPNRCDVEDTTGNEKQDSIVLTMFMPPMEPADYISRTAIHARNPRQYLQNALGPDFASREHLLSIPDKVDRDGYGTGAHKSHFEAHIAQLMGKPHGLFFITGVQAQLAAMKIHCRRAGKAKVAWHVTSHLEEAELSAWKELYGLERVLVGAREDVLPSVEEIDGVLELPEQERPAVLLVEVPNRTLGCATYSFEELERISRMCRSAGVKFHCDGARLWEIEPYYRATADKSFADICALLDTVYVSFYKGLGGVTGAMLLCPDEALLQEAKVWQRRAGGNPHTLMYEIIDCERGFNENIGTFDRKWKKMQDVVASIKAATSHFRTADGEPIINFVVDPPTCCQGRIVFAGFTAAEFDAARDKVQQSTGVRIYNRFWPKQTLDQKMKAEQEGVTEGALTQVVDRRHAVEWMMMSVTEKVETKAIVDAYVALCKELCSR